MLLKFMLFSQEKEDFAVEIAADGETKFSDLHRLILDHCQYDEKDGQRFLVCDEDWKVKTHVMLADDGKTGYDEDIYLMRDTAIGDFLEDEGQKVAYVFDPDDRRVFLMEVTEVSFSSRGDGELKVCRKHGAAPSQALTEEDTAPTPTPIQSDMEESFFDTDGYEDEELDRDGFEFED